MSVCRPSCGLEHISERGDGRAAERASEGRWWSVREGIHASRQPCRRPRVLTARWTCHPHTSRDSSIVNGHDNCHDGGTWAEDHEGGDRMPSWSGRRTAEQLIDSVIAVRCLRPGRMAVPCRSACRQFSLDKRTRILTLLIGRLPAM